MDEGVTRYEIDHERTPGPTGPLVEALLVARAAMFERGWIGRDAARYGGVGYGNASVRLSSNAFVITATQTGHIAALGPDDVTVVVSVDHHANRVRCVGPRPASSEAMTHAAVYAAAPTVGCVLHAHIPTPHWMRSLCVLPATHPWVDYGTPAMADEVGRVFAQTDSLARGIFAMGGHEGGLVTFGATPSQALARLVNWAQVLEDP